METFVSGLANSLEFASEFGVTSYDIGMSHRGRLATIACVAKKNPSEIFLDFN